jgi:hypothetical protein
VILLFLSAAATPLSRLMFFARYPNAQFQAFALLETPGLVVLWFAVIAFLLRGQAWARIATLLMVVWFFGNLAWSLFRVAGSRFGFDASFAIPVAASVLRVAALILLFGRESNAWFSSRR